MPTIKAESLVKRVRAIFQTCGVSAEEGDVVAEHLVDAEACGIVSHGVGPALSWHYIMLVAGCAFFATVLPSFLINAGLGRITPQASSMISTISPLVTIIMAMIFLGEGFTFIDAIGTALIIIGVGFYAWSDARAQKAPAT